MTGASTSDSDDRVVREAERRKRLARVFGDVLPDGTSDDREDAGGRGDGGTDDWLRRQVPPHHG